MTEKDERYFTELDLPVEDEDVISEETQIIRYVPEDINIKELLNVIMGYGCNNSTLSPEECEDNPKKFMISIRVYDVS